MKLYIIIQKPGCFPTKKIVTGGWDGLVAMLASLRDLNPEAILIVAEIDSLGELCLRSEAEIHVMDLGRAEAELVGSESEEPS